MKECIAMFVCLSERAEPILMLISQFYSLFFKEALGVKNGSCIVRRFSSKHKHAVNLGQIAVDTKNLICSQNWEIYRNSV